MRGKIYLIPNRLGNSEPADILPEGVIQRIHRIHHFIVENTRSARRFLIKTRHPLRPSELQFFELDKYDTEAGTDDYINLCLSGTDLGIITEAGMPGIADPGSVLVRKGHEKGIDIVPLIGPSSIFLALAASGMNGQNFLFHGYLPVKSIERIKKIREIEQKAHSEKQTQIFIETPYRNMSLLEDILKTCHPSTMLCIASMISTDLEFIKTLHVSSWKKAEPDLHKKPCVFLLEST